MFILDPNSNFHTLSVKKCERMSSCLGYFIAEHSIKQPVTIFSYHAFLTYRHGSHSTWRNRQTVNVFLHDDTLVECQVEEIFNSFDLVWLKPKSPPVWNYPIISNYHQGQAFYLLGFSPRLPYTPTIKSGVFGSPLGDCQIKPGFAYGHVQTTLGDSGGPCVDKYLGQLVGIFVGGYSLDKNKSYGLIVPSSVIIGLIERSIEVDRPVYEHPHFIDNS